MGDVLGDDQHAGGIPRCADLDLPTRTIVGVSSVADLGLRTAAATLVAGAMLPVAVLPGRFDSDRASLEFYAELAAGHDAEATFVPPASGHRVHASRAGRLRPRLHGARVETLRFTSRYEARNPLMRETYARHERNSVAWAQHWRHTDGPRPTLCVIHGFMGSPYALNSAFFSLPWFFEQGYDVLLYTLPFHGARAARRALVDGLGLFAGGIGHLNEAMLHAVHDFRVLVDHLQRQGVERVGVTGLSLGGYTTALLAAVDDRLHVAVPNAAVAEMSSLGTTWFPAGTLIQSVLPRRGVQLDDFAAALAVHCPLNYPVKLPAERLFVIGGLGDRLAPPEQSFRIWEHWGRPRLHWYPGNHVLHVNRGAYFRQMRTFFEETGFRPT